jgi:hypothetical protein
MCVVCEEIKMFAGCVASLKKIDGQILCSLRWDSNENRL